VGGMQVHHVGALAPLAHPQHAMRDTAVFTAVASPCYTGLRPPFPIGGIERVLHGESLLSARALAFLEAPCYNRQRDAEGIALRTVSILASLPSANRRASFFFLWLPLLTRTRYTDLVDSTKTTSRTSYDSLLS
jgi:hypothetical protein